VVDQPQHGSMGALSGSTVTYRPATNYSGTDSFTFRVRDQLGTNSNVATVSITVTAVNDAPVAWDGYARTRTGRSVTVTLAATDADGDALTYAIVGPLAKGSVSTPVSNRVTYTPATTAFTGTDSFGFRAYDGQTNSNVAVFTIEVRPMPRIERFGAVGGGSLGVWWSEATNGVYVEMSPTLMPTCQWQTVAGPLEGVTNWVLVAPTNRTQGYYRIRGGE